MHMEGSHIKLKNLYDEKNVSKEFELDFSFWSHDGFIID